MIVAVMAIQIAQYANRASSTLYAKQEILEHARNAMDTITAHVRASEEVTLATGPSGEFVSLTLRVETQPGRYVVVPGDYDRLAVRKEEKKPGYHNYVFQYSSRNKRIVFGNNNEIASYIAGFTVSITDQIMTVHIVTDTQADEGGRVLTKPIVLTSKLNLQYKIIHYSN